MDLAIALHRIWQKKLWLIPVAVLALFVSLNVAYKVSYLPPAIKSKNSQFGAATTDFVVDSSRSSLPNLNVPLLALTERAQVYAELLRTDPVRHRIGAAAGIPWRSILVDGFTSSSSNPAGIPQPLATERAVELVEDQQSRRVFFRVLEGKPIVNITTQSQTPREAAALANGAVTALTGYIGSLQRKQRFTSSRRIELHQLGTAEAGVVLQSAQKAMALIAGLCTFVFGCLMILFIPRLIGELRYAGIADTGSLPHGYLGNGLAIPPSATSEIEDSGVERLTVAQAQRPTGEELPEGLMAAEDPPPRAIPNTIEASGSRDDQPHRG